MILAAKMPLGLFCNAKWSRRLRLSAHILYLIGTFGVSWAKCPTGKMPNRGGIANR